MFISFFVGKREKKKIFLLNHKLIHAHALEFFCDPKKMGIKNEEKSSFNLSGQSYETQKFHSIFSKRKKNFPTLPSDN